MVEANYPKLNRVHCLLLKGLLLPVWISDW